MNDLFLLLFLLSFVGLIIGLIKPSIVVRWGDMQKRNRKSVCKYYGLALVASFILFGISIPNEDTTSKTELVKEVAPVVEPAAEPAVEPAAEPAAEPAVEPAAEPVVEPVKESPTPVAEGETVSQKNAVKMAKNYLSYTAFSKKGLITQLEFEGFSNEDATYAVGQVKVNWQEQAAEMAKNYLDYTAFSRSGLIEQLEFEGFSNEDATYGADAVGL